VTGDFEDLITERARLVRLRQCLGLHLAAYRYAAGMSQEELAAALGRTRSLVSKVEHGSRGLPEPLWQLADEVCRAEGALIAEYRALAQAERDYRIRWRVQHRLDQRAAGLARAAAAQTAASVVGACPAPLCDAGSHPWRNTVLDGVGGELAQELVAVMERVVRSIGRRQAMHLAGWLLATMGVSGLDAEEQTRIARAVAAPGRMDAQVVNNLAATLAHCRRLEDTLGPCAVLDTVLAQHELVHHLLQEGTEQWRKPLCLLDSSTASAIGHYLLNMGNPGTARNWFAHARKAGHDGGHPGYAAYGAAHLSQAARLAGDTPIALDAAAAARSLAARTSDPQVKAVAEQHAAGAYALDGHYDACLAAVDRAHDLLTTSGPDPGSPAYWIGHANIDSHVSTFFVLLDRPRQAVDAARNALTHFDRAKVSRYAKCQVRLGHALVLSGEIPEAARVLGSVASQAHLYPHLTAELRTTRALLQPWQHTQPVQELDAQLHACGLNVQRLPDY
jgi:transcriptional regulator with XRE-family HTH domain